MGFVYHGINLNEFYPIKDRQKVAQFRKEYFNISPETFLIININRNQPRKDLPHSIEAFAKIKKECPDSMLYLHCRNVDVGGDMGEIVEAYGNPNGIRIPENFDIIRGVNTETLNLIYNSADLYITTTLGEGWGLTTAEAFASKCLTIIPNHSSLNELGADNRSIFCNCNSTRISHEDFYRIRPVVDTNDLASKILYIYQAKKNNKTKELNMIIDNAYNWIKDLTWENVCQEWASKIKRLLNITDTQV